MKEKVYDEQINPLMAQIIAICKSHKIALIVDFGLDEDLHCTSALLADEFCPSKSQLRAHALLRPQEPFENQLRATGPHEPFAMAETIETLPDGRKKITLRRIS